MTSTDSLQFSYKDKNNKHPLRPVKQKSSEEASPTHKPTRPAPGSKATASKVPGNKASSSSKDAVRNDFGSEKEGI